MDGSDTAVTDLKCPLCKNPLAQDDYHSAVNKMKEQAELRADEKIKTEVETHQSSIKEMKESHQKALEQYRTDQREALEQQRKQLLTDKTDSLEEFRRDYDARIQEMKNEKTKEEERSKREYDDEVKRIKAELQKSSETKEGRLLEQLAELKRENSESAASAKKERDELERKIHDKYSTDLAEQRKENGKLAEALDSARETAKKEAHEAMNTELERHKKNHESRLAEQEQKIKEKNILLERANRELDDVKRKLEENQSELKGEAGELDLYRELTNAFPDDRFDRQTRGTSSADLIQHVRLSSGKFGMPIVYDNKAGGTYTKIHIEKSAKYKMQHGTEYSLIVSSKPQKSISNGLLGETDGVIVVHPSIVVEVAKTIRGGIVKIARESASQKDVDAKQGRLYRYVVGHEFSEVMKSLESADRELEELQYKEEKAHKILWDRRKAIVGKQRRAHSNLSGGIDAIIQNDALSEILPQQLPAE